MELAKPDGWTTERTVALVTLLESQAAAETEGDSSS